MKAIVLFGHAPLMLVGASLLTVWHRSGGPNILALVELAFLELMQPNLEDAIGSHLAAGASEVVVVPVFIGQGGHLRNDFPTLLSECQEKLPDIALGATSAVGENETVLQAIIDFGSKAL